jgi:hypothetical protein
MSRKNKELNKNFIEEIAIPDVVDKSNMNTIY